MPANMPVTYCTCSNAAFGAADVLERLAKTVQAAGRLTLYPCLHEKHCRHPNCEDLRALDSKLAERTAGRTLSGALGINLDEP